MGLLAPLALLLLSLALPILVLYMLRLRRPPAPVSSILLWEAVLADMEANAPWQRLRRTWLLLLQLLILLLLVLALARPFGLAAEAATGNTIVVLDASASMRATDVTPSRFERARGEVRSLIDRLAPDARMALILAGPTAEVLHGPTGDRTALTAALDRASAGAGLVNLPDALALAQAAAGRLPGSSLVIVSDGAFPPLDPAAVSLPARVLTVGGAGENVGLTALAARRTPAGLSLFARTRNAGTAAAERLLSIYADDRLVDARTIRLAGGAEAGITVDALPVEVGIIRVELDAGDALAADDRAWAVPGAGEARVLLTSAGESAFLRHGLALLPGISLFRSTDPVPAPGYDFYVFDGLVPERLPGHSLIVAPPAGNPLLPVSGEATAPRISRVARDHPLLAGVDLSRLAVARAARLERPAWAEVLVEADGLPLLLAGERDGQRLAVLTFDLRRSDLPLQVAFPILLSNLRGWLGPDAVLAGAPAGGLRPGEPIALRLGPEVAAAGVTAPDGRVTALPIAGGQARLAVTSLPGPYRFDLATSDGGRRVVWAAVNLLSDEETSIAPRAHAPLGAAAQSTPAPAEPARRELWRPLLLAGILLLLAEWWLFYRGPSRPRLTLAWRR